MKDIKAIAQEYNKKSEDVRRRVVICAGTGCVANGSLKVYEEFKNVVEELGVNLIVDIDEHDCTGEKDSVHLSKSGCQGFCAQGPLVTIYPEETLYVKVRPENVKDIVKATRDGEVVSDLL